MNSLNGKRVFIGAILCVILLIGASMSVQKPTQALPVFARQYNVPCKTCHLIPPKLNKTGLAFEANYFNLPGHPPPAAKSILQEVPISALTTLHWGSEEGSPTVAQFDTQELFLARGYTMNNGYGGYWVDYFAFDNPNTGIEPGALESAWVAAPIAGPNGQLAIQIGQFAPFNYQWDSTTILEQTSPLALDDPILTNAGTQEQIQLDQDTPGVALQYDSGRGKLSPNGYYVNLGMPLGGDLQVNKDSRLYSAQGVYLQAFQRTGYNTAGVIAYKNANLSYEGVVATRQLLPSVSVLGEASTGFDYINATTGNVGNEQHVSVVADWVICPQLALTGQYNMMYGANHDEYPALTLTWYPFNQRVIRLTGETVQDAGARSNTLWALVQL